MFTLPENVISYYRRLKHPWILVSAEVLRHRKLKLCSLEGSMYIGFSNFICLAYIFRKKHHTCYIRSWRYKNKMIFFLLRALQSCGELRKLGQNLMWSLKLTISLEFEYLGRSGVINHKREHNRERQAWKERMELTFPLKFKEYCGSQGCRGSRWCVWNR